jgi:hypothetical protein
LRCLCVYTRTRPTRRARTSSEGESGVAGGRAVPRLLLGMMLWASLAPQLDAATPAPLELVRLGPLSLAEGLAGLRCAPGRRRDGPAGRGRRRRVLARGPGRAHSRQPPRTASDAVRLVCCYRTVPDARLRAAVAPGDAPGPGPSPATALELCRQRRSRCRRPACQRARQARQRTCSRRSPRGCPLDGRMRVVAAVACERLRARPRSLSPRRTGWSPVHSRTASRWCSLVSC